MSQEKKFPFKEKITDLRLMRIYDTLHHTTVPIVIDGPHIPTGKTTLRDALMESGCAVAERWEIEEGDAVEPMEDHIVVMLTERVR
jgi:hypothetical protein